MKANRSRYLKNIRDCPQVGQVWKGGVVSKMEEKVNLGTTAKPLWCRYFLVDFDRKIENKPRHFKRKRKFKKPIRPCKENQDV